MQKIQFLTSIFYELLYENKDNEYIASKLKVRMEITDLINDILLINLRDKKLQIQHVKCLHKYRCKSPNIYFMNFCF